MNVEYNQQVYNAFRIDTTKITDIMDNLERGYYNYARNLMDDSIKELTDSILQILKDDGDRLVHNARVENLRERMQLCYELEQVIVFNDQEGVYHS